MKKTQKKLTLNRETVRHLENAGLKEVLGGSQFPPVSRTVSGEDCCITTHY